MAASAFSLGFCWRSTSITARPRPLSRPQAPSHGAEGCPSPPVGCQHHILEQTPSLLLHLLPSPQQEHPGCILTALLPQATPSLQVLVPAHWDPSLPPHCGAVGVLPCHQCPQFALGSSAGQPGPAGAQRAGRARRRSMQGCGLSADGNPLLQHCRAASVALWGPAGSAGDPWASCRAEF